MISRGIGKSAARSVARSLSQFGSGGAAPSYDTDAQTYITAVEAADGQSLETGVKDAINVFVVGCKADGIWTAIKASCILAGARTLTGALVPLVGTAPTNNNFVSGDYSRTAGLTGNGSTKYLNSNRANNADPQDNKHIAVHTTQAGSTTSAFRWYMGDDGFCVIGLTAADKHYGRINDTNLTVPGSATAEVGTIAASRDNAADITLRLAGASFSVSAVSAASSSVNHFVLRRNQGTIPGYSNARIAFYSIGEYLDLALLDTRVTTLITDIGTALA